MSEVKRYEQEIAKSLGADFIDGVLRGCLLGFSTVDALSLIDGLPNDSMDENQLLSAAVQSLLTFLPGELRDLPGIDIPLCNLIATHAAGLRQHVLSRPEATEKLGGQSTDVTTQRRRCGAEHDQAACI